MIIVDISPNKSTKSAISTTTNQNFVNQITPISLVNYLCVL